MPEPTQAPPSQTTNTPGPRPMEGAPVTARADLRSVLRGLDYAQGAQLLAPPAEEGPSLVDSADADARRHAFGEPRPPAKGTGAPAYRGRPAMGTPTSDVSSTEPKPAAAPAPKVLPQALVASFSLAPRTRLGARVQTTAETRCELRLTATSLEVSYDPALEVDMPFFMSDVAWRSASWDFATGRPGPVSVWNTQGWRLSGVGRATAHAQDLFTRALAGTVAGKPGYNPLTDPKPAETLQACATAFRAAMGPAAQLEPKQMLSPSLRAEIQLASAFEQSQGGRTLRLPAGARASIELDFAGTLADAAGPGAKLKAVRFETAALQIEEKGKIIATFTTVEMAHGGAVEVRGLRVMALREAARGPAALEALGRLFHIAARAAEGGLPGRLAAGRDPNVEPQTTMAVVRALEAAQAKDVAAALGPPLRQAILANRAVVPGVDLAKLIGIDAGAAPTPAPKQGP